jgi:hypothetical protein
MLETRPLLAAAACHTLAVCCCVAAEGSLVSKLLGPLANVGLRGMLEPIVTSIVILRDKVGGWVGAGVTPSVPLHSCTLHLPAHFTCLHTAGSGGVTCLAWLRAALCHSAYCGEQADLF